MGLNETNTSLFKHAEYLKQLDLKKMTQINQNSELDFVKFLKFIANMKAIILLTFLVGLVLADEASLRNQWNIYKLKYGKSYGRGAIDNYRFVRLKNINIDLKIQMNFQLYSKLMLF